ncbi:serine hydrolase [Paracidovorax valerianellae]|uniref:Murein-DD-endopeptidase. Serine peptidase. MEROPS family S11 n=1 Tax=Paracidovorax valerianellae TaxID=187868 RepID=A0A1G6UMU1_9BURK|nr:serine hydrolase [Paracidovorax valerianellae]MDA8446854.1 peptidase S11 [Paracidovorax valerianellae]SDD42678.1 murein-DD-endopeptidase. Serine peptidase. MEROPS family S11 [Paracidovorax valerianellae]
MHVRPRASSRFFRTVAFLAMSIALTATTVHAAERKKVQIKKQAASTTAKQRPVARSAKAVSRKAVTNVKATRVSARSVKTVARMVAVPEKLSFGQVAGLHSLTDPLDLKSSVALVIDQDTNEVLLSKNDHAVLPIASLTKLMTGLLVSQAHLPMDEPITITQDDVDTEKFSSSRLAVGTTLTRGEMMHLALMSSENRAAHALGRTFPGGLESFVAQMNAKAKLLGMTDTRYVEPTGLSSHNQSSARDLATLVNVAHGDPMLRELTTSPSYEVAVGRRTLQYNNTNRLVKSPVWDIGLQKTGYISEAGRCLVMQAQISGRKLIMVFLDSAGKFSRLGDAERVRTWVEKLPAIGTVPTLHAIGTKE